MKKSVHLKCEREGGTLRGLSIVDKEQRRYRSISWEILPTDAETLVGGWVYFDPAKPQKSEFGGKIVGVELLDTKSAHGHPEIGLIFEARAEARGQLWRGADHQMAHRSLVDADFPHEAS